MENSKSNFEALVAKMQGLEETEQGKLKGGFAVLNSEQVDDQVADPTNYFQCTCTNNVPCK